MGNPNPPTPKTPNLVGQFIRNRRDVLGLSQRALGQFFTPPVTTQFISNIERGVTPLPPAHVPVLAQALQVTEQEILLLLEREFAAKLTGRLGVSVSAPPPESQSQLLVSGPDYAFMRSLYDAYRSADPRTRQAFATVCESMLNVPKNNE